MIVEPTLRFSPSIHPTDTPHRWTLLRYWLLFGDTVINLARAMPKLEYLHLGDAPCRHIPTGVTAKGLVVLAHHCPNLTSLCIHFQVASLSALSAAAGTTSGTGPTAPRGDCVLTELEVGEIPVPEQSVLVVVLTLVRVFPHMQSTYYVDGDWRKVMDAIFLSRKIVDFSSKQLPFATPRSGLDDTHQESHSGTAVTRETVRGDSVLTLHRPFHVSLAQQNHLLRLPRTVLMYDKECCGSDMRLNSD